METSIDVTPTTPAFARMVDECLMCEREIAPPDPCAHRRSLPTKVSHEEGEPALQW
ncbi:hypothetical protein [Caballeronia sp. DA-9]|uniref:hypothetical protein n=1 Tax=Caballeronia sp. DA-9 TaxID=3436237 RepID=UPI003F681925